MINISGLALAVGCCLMVFEYSYWAMLQDAFNAKIDHLFVVEKIADKNGEKQYYGDAPTPLGLALKTDFPQVKNIARLNYTGVIIKQKDNIFREKLTFVDDDCYKMFELADQCSLWVITVKRFFEYEVAPLVLLSVIALVFTTLLSVSWHITKASQANISKYLKEE